MLRTTQPKNLVCEQQAKFIQERIAFVEKSFSELSSIFSSYTRKTAGLREKSDELAQAVRKYAESENVNKSLKNGFLLLSSTLAGIGDYRDVEVKRLEQKIVGDIGQYELICRSAKEEVKTAFLACDREIARRKQLDNLKQKNPRNRQHISHAETELLKASADVSRMIKALEEQIDIFEKKKLHDIKSLFLSFVLVELSFHTKAVELYTKAYQEIDDIDEEEDLKEFRNALHVPESVSRLDTVKRASFRASSFSLANLFSSSVNKSSQDLTPSPLHNTVTLLRPQLNDSIESGNSLKPEDEMLSSISDSEHNNIHPRRK